MVPTGERPDVAAQGLLAHLLVGVVIAPFAHRPEALDAIHVRHSVDILRDGMPDCLVAVGNAMVALVLVGVDHRLRIDVLLDEWMQGLRVCAADHLRSDCVRLPVLDADNGGLADSAPAGVLARPPLRVAHVLPQRIGTAGAERVLPATIDAGLTSGTGKPRAWRRVTVDTTVPDQAVTFPTDGQR